MFLKFNMLINHSTKIIVDLTQLSDSNKSWIKEISFKATNLIGFTHMIEWVCHRQLVSFIVIVCLHPVTGLFNFDYQKQCKISVQINQLLQQTFCLQPNFFTESQLWHFKYHWSASSSRPAYRISKYET